MFKNWQGIFEVYFHSGRFKGELDSFRICEPFNAYYSHVSTKLKNKNSFQALILKSAVMPGHGISCVLLVMNP